MDEQDKKIDNLETPEIKYAPDWPPQPKPAVDPALEATLDDIKDDPDTKQKYIQKVREQLETVYDPEISEELEREYWVQRLGKQAAMDMIAYGRVGVGNMDSIVMLNKEDQRNALQHAADIAITNESRMNHIRDESVKRLENGIDQHEMIKQLGLTKD